MTLTAQIQSTISIAGLSVTSVTSRSAVAAIPAQTPTPAAGLAGSLTTRTDADTGIITMSSAEHGITDADTVDVYWSGGCRYGMTVTLVDGTAVSIDAGTGDDLPAAETAVVVGVQEEYDVDFDGDLVKMIVAHCKKRAHIEFLTNGDVSILGRELTANEAWSWVYDTGAANPLTGDPVGKILVSCGETTTDQIKLVGIYDSEV